MTALAKIARLAIGAAACAMAGPVLAQEDYAAPRAEAYGEALAQPDWTGIWYPDWALLFATRNAPPQLTPAAQDAFDAYQESIRENGPNQEAQARCLPPGIPGVMQQPYPIEILYSPGQVTILTEAYQQVRRIYTDGRSLPAVPDLFFNGNSVGFWEGDVLVADTVGLHPDTNIAPGIAHTEQSHVHEHIYRQSDDILIVEVTITNPEVLEQPYQTSIAFRQDNSFPMREYVCAENNRLTTGEDGANIDLGFDGFDALEED